MDISDLREKIKELETKKREQKEYAELMAHYKALQEEGTLKSKIKKGILSVREHLREKGKSFQDDGKKLSGEKKDSNMFKDTPIAKMNEKTTWKSPLYDELTRGKEPK